MTTPTDYSLDYPDPCTEEDACGEGICLGQLKFSARPIEFCEDVTIDGNLRVTGNSTFNGNVSITPAQITVGGQTYTPKVINTISGPHLVLAVY